MIFLGRLIKLRLVIPILWYPVVLQKIDWRIFPIFLIRKKIPALKILFFLKVQRNIFYLYLLLLSGLANIILLNQSNLKKFFSWSSIRQGRLLLLLLNFKISLFIVYFFFYRVRLFFLILFLKKNFFKKMVLIFLLFFQRGFPPFLMFFVKIKFLLFLSKNFKTGCLFIIVFMIFLYIGFLGYLKIFFKVVFWFSKKSLKKTFIFSLWLFFQIILIGIFF